MIELPSLQNLSELGRIVEIIRVPTRWQLVYTREWAEGYDLVPKVSLGQLLDARFKHTSDFCGYSVDTQCHKPPCGVDLVPLDHGSATKSETVYRTDGDRAGTCMGLVFGIERYMANLEGVVVDIRSF